jgi:hypothetical protein
MQEDDFDPLFRYRRRVTDDPIRLHILAAHALIEEMLELVIAEAVPNSECFEVSKMQFWKKLDIVRALERQIHPDRSPGRDKAIWEYIEKLTRLRNVAAHKEYEERKERLFTEFAEFFYPDPSFRSARSRDALLQEGTEVCTGYLMGMAQQFRRLPQREGTNP